MNVLMIVPDTYNTTSGYRLTVVPSKEYIDNLEDSRMDLMPVKTQFLSAFEKKEYRIKYKSLNNDCNYDLIIGYTINPCYLLFRDLKSRESKKKYVAFLADSMLLHEKSILPYIPFGKRKIKESLRLLLYRYKERYVLKKCDGAIYVSNVDMQFAKNEYDINSDKVFYLPNGYRLPEQSYTTRINKNNIKLGLMSTFYQDKLEDNVYPFLNDIFPALKERYPSLELILAGGGASKDTEEYLRSINGVKYLGYVESLDEFYSNVDVVVSAVRKECGILNRVIEAWAYGKTVMGFRKNFKTFLDALDGIHYIAADNKDEFIVVMDNIIAGKIDCYEIGTNARRLIREKYSWDICGKRLQTVLESINN